MKKNFSKFTAMMAAALLAVGPNLMASEAGETTQVSESQETASINLEEMGKDFDLKKYAQYDKVTGQDEKNILDFLMQMPAKNLTADLTVNMDATMGTDQYVVSYEAKMLKNLDNELSLDGKASVNLSNAFNFELEPKVAITLDPSSTETERKYIVSTKIQLPGQEPQVDSQELKIDEETSKILDVLSKLKYDLRQVEEKDGEVKVLALIPIEENMDEMVPYAAEKGYLKNDGEQISEEEMKKGLEELHSELNKVKEAGKIETMVLPLNLTYSTDTKTVSSINMDLASYFNMMLLINTLDDGFASSDALQSMKELGIQKCEMSLNNIKEQDEKIAIEALK